MKGRELAKLSGLGRNLWKETLRLLVADEQMAPSWGLGTAMSEDGRGAGPTRNIPTYTLHNAYAEIFNS